jgi:hypothetical protein
LAGIPCNGIFGELTSAIGVVAAPAAGHLGKVRSKKESAKMPEYRMKVAPDTVAFADGENHKLIVEFAIPGAPADTIDVKILEYSVHPTAPAMKGVLWNIDVKPLCSKCGEAAVFGHTYSGEAFIKCEACGLNLSFPESTEVIALRELGKFTTSNPQTN